MSDKPDFKEIEQFEYLKDEKNKGYSAMYASMFLIIHCMSGFFFGYQLSVLNNLGKPILEGTLDVHGNDADNWLGRFGMGFGLGKVCGSLIGGSLAKILGKLNILFLAEL